MLHHKSEHTDQKYYEYVIYSRVVLCRYAVDFCYIVNIYIFSTPIFFSPDCHFPSHEYVCSVVTCVCVEHSAREPKKRYTAGKQGNDTLEAVWYQHTHTNRPSKWQATEITSTKIEVNSSNILRATERIKESRARVWWRSKTSMKHERCNVVIKIIFVKPIGDNK